jgi:hypothetical protein
VTYDTHALDAVSVRHIPGSPRRRKNEPVHFGKGGKPEIAIAKISQETLAEMIGTTRSRVSFFMNNSRKMECIEYNNALHTSEGEGGAYA